MSDTFRVPQVISSIAVLLMIAIVVAWYFGIFSGGRSQRSDNSIMVIAPYRHAGTWVFDDPSAGLTREPFVSGIPEMIDRLVAEIPDAENGFRMLFSARPFPGHQQKLTWLRGDSGGNWYRCEELKMEGWLCPALFKYFADAPQELYVKAESNRGAAK